MFSPEMMQAAQKMMANMKPEDMARMSQMASNMDPKVMEGMMKSMGGGNMPAGVDTKQALDQMKNMSPEQLRQGMSQAQQQMSAQKTYYCNAAEMLKNEGNELIKGATPNYKEALEKYGRALENLKSHSGADVEALQLAMLNNSALCHLKMKSYSKAVEATEEALKLDRNSFKAYYRRGQAREQLGQLVECFVDVRTAASISPKDKAIATELARLKTVLKEKGIEEPSEAAAPEVATPSASSSSRPAADSSKWAETAEKLAENPDMLKHATEAMSKMSPEDMERMMGSSNLPPGMDSAAMKQQLEFMQKNPEMMKNAMDSLKAMPEEERKKMLASRMGGGAPGGKMPDAADMQKLFDNPDMINQALDMTKNMSEEDLRKMNLHGSEDVDMMRKAAEQMRSDPGMANAMSEMMKNMTPEQMQSMMEMSASMRGAGSASASGDAGDMAPGGMDPSAMLNDPKMMKAAEEMMKNMSPEMMSSMAKASGIELDESKAKLVTKFLPWLMRLMRWFGHLKKTWSVLWSPKGRIALAALVVGIAAYQHYRS
eukprot:TRINITY_DN54749_c0_g1_i1.p1 TRINITY_DN54749_c0_g1~~TRINITY_DN54749_c0_g1_i1.p1  ORF type:complete len:544 (+),score=168.73 TRINITY_DN54749_c0_g1_i1:158-1789(+)